MLVVMNRKSSCCFVACFVFFAGLITGLVQAQEGAVRGQALDSLGGSPLFGASVAVFKKGSSAVAAGGVAATTGKFAITLPFGTYLLKVDFLGYQPFVSKEFTVSAKDPIVDWGVIRLLLSGSLLQEVVVQAEKSFMQMSLDKKIFNVGKDLANAGGSASDILLNIPSVSVDAEGNVRLRGSDNVRILIDGKPSGLVSIKGGSGLQQLQANMVDRVELITNPSARYEAEGMAGIINIILKKDRRQGFNGSFELLSGTPTNFGIAANLNYRKNNVNFFINYGLAHRIQPTRGMLYQEVYEKDSTFIFKQADRAQLKGLNNNVRAGLDYFFNEKNVLTVAYLYRRSEGNRIRNIRYDDFLFNSNNPTGFSTRSQDEDEVEPNAEVSVNYKRSFAQKGHEFTAEVKYIDYWENSDQVFTQYSFTPSGSIISAKNILQTSVNDEFEKQWLFQVDYTKPLGKQGKLETGLRSSLRNMINDYVVAEQDRSGTFLPLPGLDNIFVYDENIHGAYAIMANRAGKFAYQAGMRTEWTDVTTTLLETNEKNPRDYLNFFPSGHLSVELARANSLQLSYSRRVRRPFYNDLSPYATFSDSRNFSSGNPDLDPEFSHVLELGHLKNFDKGSISSSMYYRQTQGRIERIRQVDKSGNALIRPENLLAEQAWGIEFTAGYVPYAWWKLDFNANFFRAHIDGSNILPAYKTDTYSWFARQTSRFSLKKNLDVQWRLNYEAPQKTVQGRRKSIAFADLSFSRDLMKERATLNLNILDVFQTRKSRNVVNGENFSFDGYGGFRPRQVNLTFTYRVKQTKSTKNIKLTNSD